MREPSINLLSVLILIGSAQALSLALALAFMRRGNMRANLFLAVLLFLLSLGLIDGFLNVTNYYTRYPHLIGVTWPGFFLGGPFLYFYVRELSVPKRMDGSGKHLLHYLPAALCTLLLVPFYRMSADGKIQVLASLIEPVQGLRIFSLAAAPFLVVFQKTVYYLLSLRLIRDYSIEIKQSFSSIEKISLSWLRSLLILFFFLCVVFVLYSFFTSPFGIYGETGYVFYLLEAFVAYVIAFKGLLQPEIFSRIETVHQVELSRIGQDVSANATILPLNSPRSENGTAHKGKYQKSLLSEERVAEIHRQLLQVMETERPFLEPELDLPELADRLSVSPHHLSQVINREMNKSFFDFINEYRVREAKGLLSSQKSNHLSILGIALDAGFNSKSAFYTAFSKYTGMTPSEFRKRRAWAEPAAPPAP